MTVLPEQPIAVLGAGSWGTALAIQLARNGQPTLLWGHDPEHMAQITAERCNRRYLPDITLPDHLTVESELDLVLQQVRDVLIVVPSLAYRQVLESVVTWHKAYAVALDGEHRRVAWATKGLEPHDGRLLHETAMDILGPDVPLAVLSGPTFAAEVASGLPTAITLACRDVEFTAALLTRLHDDRFRVYTSEDLVGVGLGGAVKNVLAIAAGIADGLHFGANSRAALVTRGLAEMMRLGVALGGQRETFMGLAGLGDLVLTCTDNQSRNRRLGLALASGQTVEAAQKAIGQVVEGVTAAREIRQLMTQYAVEMPIVDQVYRILYQGVPIAEAVTALFSRQPRDEQV